VYAAEAQWEEEEEEEEPQPQQQQQLEQRQRQKRPQLGRRAQTQLRGTNSYLSKFSLKSLMAPSVEDGRRDF